MKFNISFAKNAILDKGGVNHTKIHSPCFSTWDFF